MYSAAKYPAYHTYKEYELAIKPKFRKQKKPYEIYKSPVPISEDSQTHLTSSSKLEDATDSSIQEKLQFYYVKPKPIKKDYTYQNQRPEFQYNVTSVDSLLPFHKEDTQKFTNLQSDKIDDKSQIEDAPDSILQPWHASDIESPSTYMYAPTLGEVIFKFVSLLFILMILFILV